MAERAASRPIESSVIVAVIGMLIMEMPCDNVVDVIGMRHGLVPALRIMLVRSFVGVARVPGCTLARV